MISRIGANSYRCFSHLDLEVPRHAVLAGANGMGKSTLIDIPVLLGDILKGGLQQALLERVREGHGPRSQTYRDILHRGQGTECSLVIEAELPASVKEMILSAAPKSVKANPPTHVRYAIRLRLVGETELVIDDEHLDLFPASARSPDLSRVPDPQRAGWRPVIDRQHGSRPLILAEYRRGQLAPDDISPDRLALSHVSDQLLFPAATWLVALLKEGAMSYTPDCGKLRQARAPERLEGLREDATNLPSQILRLQENPDRLAEWVNIVRLALPNVVDIRAVEREEDHYTYLRLAYRYGDASGADYAVTSSGLSDGTLRILAFSLLPYLERLPQLLAVEQPEDGIHPRAIDVVLESLSGLPDTQTIVTTHSPIVLARTSIENLICLRRDDQGSSEAVNGPRHPHLQQWQQELDLGALFAAGVLS